MILIPGGTYMMGSDRFYEEEGPRRRVSVAPFWMDATPVTNRDFAAFVTATNYRTCAEYPPDAREYPGMDDAFAKPGSLVFQRTEKPVHMSDPNQWWAFVPGADWCHPTGPDSNVATLLSDPVVHVTHDDAAAYARWAGKSLPTEAEWEFAARGKLENADYAWGDQLAPGGKIMANYWQGAFPHANTRADGGYRTTPVGSYPPNGYGLYDMIGNVWEWTSDWYAAASALPQRSCCVTPNPRGGTRQASIDPDMPDVRIARRVIKGGSHLCSHNYCQRYRPAARHPQMVDTSASHVGFRCILRCATAPQPRRNFSAPIK